MNAVPKVDDKYEVENLNMYEIFADPDFNCRGEIIPLDVLDLAKSIKERGLDQPITVQPYEHGRYKWRVVAGHRRHMAFQINQMNTIPCFIRRDLTELQAHTYNLVENLQRQQLNIMQEANALKYYFSHTAFNDGDLASMFGQSRGWVQIRRDLLSLPPDIQKEAAAGVLNQNHIKQLAKVKNQADMYELTRRIKDLKAKGENPTLTPTIQRPSDAFKAKHRSRPEMVEMLTLIYGLTGPDLHTRCLAWATGEISTVALMNDVKEYCDDHQKPFKMPGFIKQAVQGEVTHALPVVA